MRQSFSMTKTVSVVGWSGLGLLLVILAARLVWHAAPTETGKQFLGMQWRDATLGWFVGEHEPVNNLLPIEQADYWLRETDRVLAKSPDNAQLMMGAALILDSPGTGYVSRFFQPPTIFSDGATFFDVDRKRAKQAEEPFENRCQSRCLELAAAAAKQDPTNVEWWRLLALLGQRSSTIATDAGPRDAHWLDTLQECASHDPDNALYDYLAADRYWHASAEWDYSGNHERLKINDPDQFALGVARFEQGQAKSCFAIGDVGFTATAKFLSQTQLPLVEQEHLVNSRYVALRRDDLLHNLYRWQSMRARQLAEGGDPAGALALSQQELRVLDQFEASGPSGACDQTAIASKVAAVRQRQTFADVAKVSLKVAERDQLTADREGAILRREVVNCAARDLASGENPPLVCGNVVLSRVRVGLALAGDWIVAAAPSLLVVLFLLAIVATALSRRSASDALPVVGIGGAIATLTVSLLATLLIFGLAPAEIVGRPAQAWFFTILLYLLLIGAIGWLGWRWLRRRSSPFIAGDLLLPICLIAMFVGLVAVAGTGKDCFGSFPFQLSMPARSGTNVDARYVSVITNLFGPWPWTVYQWLAYAGPFLTLALWVGLSAALYRHRLEWMRQTSGTPLPTFGTRLRGLLRWLSGPLRMMTAAVLLAYLLAAPQTLESIEQHFQERMAFARDPQAHWTKVTAALKRVRADEKLMSELQTLARHEAAQPVNSALDQ